MTNPEHPPQFIYYKWWNGSSWETRKYLANIDPTTLTPEVMEKFERLKQSFLGSAQEKQGSNPEGWTRHNPIPP